MLRLALAQFNAAVGDLWGNVEIMRRLYAEAAGAGADIVVFPEMAVCGYPPEDLLMRKHFLDDNLTAMKMLIADCAETVAVVGFAHGDNNSCYNGLAVLQKGQIQSIYHKCKLPNYGVFDEERYFKKGDTPVVIDVDGIAVALTICEDIWDVDWLAKSLGQAQPVDVLVNIAASPFHIGKISERKEILQICAKRFGCAVAYCNLIGGQDELVFDGQSMIVSPAASVVAQGNAFAEDLVIADIDKNTDGKVNVEAIKTSVEEPNSKQIDISSEIYEALVLGTRDYTIKNGFKKVIIGLSGGIDSALTAVIAADALGRENVVGVTMPSKFSSDETIGDSEKIARNLGIEFQTVPIGTVLNEFDKTLDEVAGWDNEGIAYENLQARIRGCILMSLSNKFGYLVLTTGNKSEIAVGYTTLYGDAAGGFAVIKDVPKTMVYELSKYVNKIHGDEIIPQTVLERAPSAELRPDQKDSDSLPDYELLDRILKGYVEEDKSAQALVAMQLPEGEVNRIISMVDRNEYKRRQSAPGVKITPKAFGKDRRLPITNLYKER